MTKKEAIEAMLNGSKVFHPDTPWILYMESGTIYNTEGRIIFFEYWTGRFEDGWSIYREDFNADQDWVGRFASNF